MADYQKKDTDYSFLNLAKNDPNPCVDVALVTKLIQ